MPNRTRLSQGYREVTLNPKNSARSTARLLSALELQSEDFELQPEDFRHVFPYAFEHIIPYGQYFTSSTSDEQSEKMPSAKHTTSE